MLRRTLLKIVTALVVVGPMRALARVLQGPALKPLEVDTLTAVADVVLPSSLDVAGKAQAVKRFVAWCANYREGADMGHGYGASTLRSASGPSPALRYPEQFAALDAAARARGAATFAALARTARLEIIEKVLNEPRPVNRLPAQPTGANVIADFMGSYFTSADAWDRCYRAEIGRDSCRTLENSADQPRPRQDR
jgi:hypothetical protein